MGTCCAAQVLACTALADSEHVHIHACTSTYFHITKVSSLLRTRKCYSYEGRPDGFKASAKTGIQNGSSSFLFILTNL